jgi:polyhydroxyalkanoate synthesis regulator phasin
MQYLQASVLSLLVLSLAAWVYAAEQAPSTSDQEIAKAIVRLEEGQKFLQQQMNDLKTSIGENVNLLRQDMDKVYSGLQKRVDAVEDSLRERISDANALLRLIIPMLGAIFLAIAGGATVIWRQVGIIEGRIERLKELQPSIERIIELQPSIERIIELQPSIERLVDFQASIEQLEGAQQEMRTNVERIIREQQEVLRQMRVLSDLFGRGRP